MILYALFTGVFEQNLPLLFQYQVNSGLLNLREGQHADIEEKYEQKAYFARSKRAEDSSDGRAAILLFPRLLIVLAGNMGPAVCQLDRSSSILVRELVTECNVRDPEVTGRDDGLLLTRLELETPAVMNINTSSPRTLYSCSTHQRATATTIFCRA